MLDDQDQELDDKELDEMEIDDLEADDFEADDMADDDLEAGGLEDEETEGDETFVARDQLAPISPAPGCAVSFYIDNKRHHAVCLAVIGDELLLEHKGASRCFLFTGKVMEVVQRLRLGVASATIIVGSLKACRYRSVHKKWLRELVKTGQTWKGIERGGGLVPSPAELLKDNGQLELF